LGIFERTMPSIVMGNHKIPSIYWDAGSISKVGIEHSRVFGSVLGIFHEKPVRNADVPIFIYCVKSQCYANDWDGGSIPKT